MTSEKELEDELLGLITIIDKWRNAFKEEDTRYYFEYKDKIPEFKERIKEINAELKGRQDREKELIEEFKKMIKNKCPHWEIMTDKNETINLDDYLIKQLKELENKTK